MQRLRHFSMPILILSLLSSTIYSRARAIGVFAKGWAKQPVTFSSSYHTVVFMHAPRGGGNDATVNPTEPSSSSPYNHEDIVIPEREYGYRKEPFTWKELKYIIEEERNLGKLSRSIQQEREYQIAMKEMRTKWKSVYDSILCKKFGFEKRPFKNETHTVWEAYPAISEIKEPQKVLVQNDFPYYNGPGIEHYVLWKLCEDITDADIEEAKQQLRQDLGDVVDILWWKNPPHLKSLPDLDHIHILVLRDKNESHS